MRYRYFVSYAYREPGDGKPCDFGNTLVERDEPIRTIGDIVEIECGIRRQEAAAHLEILHWREFAAAPDEARNA